jgi:haloacetate dehalogenase
MAMFEGFDQRVIKTDGASINLVTAGQGPPLLLLHGYPQTHAMWHLVAPRLAETFSVVVPDLRGYGDSAKPGSDPEHMPYSKRVMAQDQVEVMRQLGFDRFAVAGHDRGARVAYRMTLDHPSIVTRLAVLDVVPTHAMFASVDKEFATNTFHWFFLVQPYDFPEHLIGGDPEYFLRSMLGLWSGGTDVFGQEALAEYIRCFSDPATIHASCEDYRAGATVDLEHDTADFGRRMIDCPLFVLWSQRLGSRQRDPLATWRQWASDVRGQALACGHFIPEEAPQETASALLEFFSRSA